MDVVAVSRDWNTVPDKTTTYKVVQGMLFEIAPNPVTAAIRLFSTSVADVPAGSPRSVLRESLRCKQQLCDLADWRADRSGKRDAGAAFGRLLDLALTTALNDTGTVANRQTAPSSGVGAFTAQPAFLSVPSPGNLPAVRRRIRPARRVCGCG